MQRGSFSFMLSQKRAILRTTDESHLKRTSQTHMKRYSEKCTTIKNSEKLNECCDSTPWMTLCKRLTPIHQQECKTIICTRLRSLGRHCLIIVESTYEPPRCPTLQSHLRAQHDPFCMPHPDTGASLPKIECQDERHRSECFNSRHLDAVERQRLREQTSWMSMCSNLRHIQPTLVLLSARFGVRVLLPQLTLQRTAHFPTTKVTPPSAFLTRISRILRCGQASLHSLRSCLLDVLSNRCRCMPGCV